ncbi:MAG: hypothetical protein AUK24_03660 [Syntrophaceae bacterium CG2_30_49_12]|nr:MAG: hypothetical protein AUK24_03660 [Syntrophaceae bacterium CG2_30_49_12]PIP07326.1 MAG: hypothetical protein COX52_04110 [Syntrophobacterales bacterium CG23_combo_of_CG06-09_8_20_14_all_48_27]PJA49408.1 MAG: hypothetical protein CO171_05295 [Syntrophobacterales bacterium CG_4_9_14_3_um_filter_49_8]PJC75274.1 MAG: hypothetical protein CO012_03765 [Syntrophobacterales bacterium CG_4_8_14_3_um_filter_49_14]
MTKYENAIEFAQIESENYTHVIFETLQLGFPGGASPWDAVVRERPTEPLLERSPEEIEKLREHPLFAGS